MKLVIATNNPHKLVEFGRILAPLGIEVHSQKEYCPDLDVEETGTTFAENSLLKAKAVMEASGLPAIADDSGLCVDWLQGAPGIYSARYGGVDSDEERNQLLLSNMRGATNRAAHFHADITCCFPNGDVLNTAGDIHGTIAYAPNGEGGFGYDPIFFVPELRKTLAQVPAEDKNAISHRGNALRAMAVALKEYLEKN